MPWVKNSEAPYSSLRRWASELQRISPPGRATAAIDSALEAVPVAVKNTSTSRSKVSLKRRLTEAVSASLRS